MPMSKPLHGSIPQGVGWGPLGSVLSGSGGHRPACTTGPWRHQPRSAGILAQGAPAVCVSSGCSNRVPSRGGFKQQKCRASGFWRPEVRNRGAAGPSSRGALSVSSPCFWQVADKPGAPWLTVPLPSLPLSPQAHLLVTGHQPYQTGPYSRTASPESVTSVRTPFPHQAVFEGPGG